MKHFGRACRFFLGMNGEEFCDFALDEAGVALLPGSSFGQYGEEFVRICYVNSIENIELAIEKLNDTLIELTKVLFLGK